MVIYKNNSLYLNTDRDSNYKLIFDNLFSKLNVPEQNINKIDPNLELSRCANDYSDKINTKIMRKNSMGVPIFDLIVLGMGPDCHICSIFPDSCLLKNYDDQIISKLWIASVNNSPKPPLNRITLTMPILDACEKIFVIAYGDEKHDALNKCFCDIIHPRLPASILCRNDMTIGENDCTKRITWFVDEKAKLNIENLLNYDKLN